MDSSKSEGVLLTCYYLVRVVAEETKSQSERFSPGYDFRNIQVEDVKKQHLWGTEDVKMESAVCKGKRGRWA